ncbi:MAG: tetratricopeptide repeat protein [Bacteroidota bacterium]
MSNLPDFDQLWDFRDPAATELAFKALIPLAESADNESYKGQLFTQIARTLGLQRKFEDAHAVLDAIAQSTLDAHPIVRVRFLLERGRVFNSSRNKPAAKPLFAEAWEFGKIHKLDYFAVDAAHMMGFIFSGSEKVDQKLAWEEKALALAESSPSEKAKKWLGSLYNNIGWSYHEMKAFAKAKSMFEKCLDWQQANEKIAGAKISKWSIAKMDRLLGNTQQALTSQLTLLKADGGQDEYGYTFEEIAECYLVLQQSDQAAQYAKKAWELLSKDPWLCENEPERVKRLKQIGNS